MKKLIYVILLLLLIFPFNVQAETTNYYIEKKSLLTEEQREEYLNIVLTNSNFIEDSKNYKYYLILYQESNNKPCLSSYKNTLFVMFFNSIPTITYDSSNVFYPLQYNTNLADKSYMISLSGSINEYSLNNLNLITFDHQDNTNYYYFYQVDYVLASNFSLSLGFDLTLLNEDLQELGVIKATDNIFETSFIEIEKDYSLEDILNSEDIIYSLSKQLIGPLPVEFEFIYSVVALGLAILIILVVLSPFIILFKIWR